MSERTKLLTASVFAAAALAVAIILPVILQRGDTEYPFRGVENMGPDAEIHNSARVQEIYDGFWKLGNTFYTGPKDQFGLQTMIPELPMAWAGNILHINAVQTFILSKAFFGFALLFLFALFAWSITGSVWISLVSAITVLFAGALLSSPWDIIRILGDPWGTPFDFLRFARGINPQWPVMWFLGVLTCTAVWIRERKTWLMIAAAVCVTVDLYSYFYAWSYAFAAIGLLCLWYAWKRDAARVKDLTIFWIVTIILAIPYGFELHSLFQNPYYTESAARLGMVQKHTPALGVWMFAFLGIALLTKKRWPGTWPMLPMTALAGIIAINQQVITGHFIVPAHYHWYFIQPLAGLFAVALTLDFIRKLPRVSPKVFTGLLICVTVVSVGYGFFQQLRAYQDSRALWGEFQASAPVLRYIRDHFHPGDAVYSVDSAFLDLVPIYTSADVYKHADANIYPLPVARPRDAFFLDLWVEGVTPGQAAEDFYTTRRWSLSSRLFCIYYRELLGDYAKIPDDVIAPNVAAYRAYSGYSLDRKMSLWPLTVIVTSPHDPDTAQYRELISRGTEVFSANGYRVLTVGSQE